jgi:hypothetical protein
MGIEAVFHGQVCGHSVLARNVNNKSGDLRCLSLVKMFFNGTGED